MGVAIGSACQIALFVIPACVVIAWVLDKDLNLNFSAFDTVTLLGSTLVVTMIIQHGESHWLHGMLLIVAYVMISAAYWFHKDEDLEASGGR